MPETVTTTCEEHVRLIHIKFNYTNFGKGAENDDHTIVYTSIEHHIDL
jgi:hypothetical protein